MAMKINRAVTINGKKKWIRANTEQEYAEKLRVLFQEPTTEHPAAKHNYGEYAQNWFELYCVPNVEKATVACYRNLLRKHILPELGAKNLEDISTNDVQRLFNSMTGAKTTKQKAKAVLNMIFELAIDDDLISKNPLNAKRLKITGKESTTTAVYSVEQMRFLTQHISLVRDPNDRKYLALQALHPLRMEEVLGLKWEDIDLQNKLIHVRRAVTHPERNQPEIKVPKTQSSIRTIGLSEIARNYLVPGNPDDFVVGDGKPLSYHRVVRMCARIQKDIGFEEKITPKRFRPTVLTDIYEQTKDIKATQAAAGHTTASMTLEHYVKGRGRADATASAIDSIYGTRE